MKNAHKIIGIIAAIVLFGIGIWLGYALRGDEGKAPAAHDHAQEATEWVCPMHPQIRQSEPGRCPICGMDLAPVTQTEATGPREFVTSPEALALMDVRTAPVERRAVTVDLRLVGRVTYDERRLAYLTAWVPGRIEKLHVNFTGATVAAGDPMVDLYSPELIQAQEELLQALRTAKSAPAASGNLPAIGETLVNAARERLRQWGLTAEQIGAIAERGRVENTVTLHAPVGGVVTRREGQLGMYVQTGTRLFTIADLSHVWLQLDAYESDLPWIRMGQSVSISSDSAPGETFEGTVAFIDPTLNPMTRTVQVRVEAANPEGRLKPEMFVRAVLHAPVGPEGRVAEGAEGPAPLVIPATAPLITGTRAVVYVQSPDAEKPTFEGRDIVLGPRAGAYYVVLDGLEEGELVAARGAFKIDSAVQIAGGRSMMQPAGGGMAPGHQHGPAQERPAAREEIASHDAPQAFRAQLGQFVAAYFDTSEALASDDAATASSGAQALRERLNAVDMTMLEGQAHEDWMRVQGRLTRAIQPLARAREIEAMRRAFEPLSMETERAVKSFGVNRTVYKVHCPMAFNNRGADWLQATDHVRNPYFGASMLTCGEVAETISPAAPQDGAHRHD